MASIGVTRKRDGKEKRDAGWHPNPIHKFRYNENFTSYLISKMFKASFLRNKMSSILLGNIFYNFLYIFYSSRYVGVSKSCSMIDDFVIYCVNVPFNLYRLPAPYKPKFALHLDINSIKFCRCNLETYI